LKAKGSITIYICLTMIVVLSLITTGIRSAIIADARVSMVSAMDLGLYSLFGQYDKELMEEFGLLFIDGGYGNTDLQLGNVYQELEKHVTYNLFLESWKGEWRPSVTAGSINGYTLATDNNGGVFKEQVIAYMKETLGAQGIQFLLEQVNVDSEIIKQHELEKEKISSGDIETYETMKKAQEEAERAAALAGDTNEEGATNEIEVPVDPGFVNPIEIIKSLKDLGTLALLIPDEDKLSRKEVDLSIYTSKRELQQGLGVVSTGDETEGLVNDMLFQEYLLKNYGNYVSPKVNAALEYQLEYLLEGKNSDVENLKGVANKLLLIREAINIVHIATDTSKRSQTSAMALTIASLVGMPPLYQIIEPLLIVFWAFGESVLDVRALFNGEKVPLLKDNSTWKLSLSNLGNLPQIMSDNETTKDSKGLDYQGYLRLLLLVENDKNKVMRGMDVVEMTIGSIPGRENFRLDSCIASLEVEMQMKIWKNEYSIWRSYGYDM